MIPINQILDESWLATLKLHLAHTDVMARRAEIALHPYGIRMTDRGQLVVTTTIVLFGSPPIDGLLLGPATAVTLHRRFASHIPVRARFRAYLTVQTSEGAIRVLEHRTWRRPTMLTYDKTNDVAAVVGEQLCA